MKPLVIDEGMISKTDALIAAQKSQTENRPNYFVTGPRCFNDEDLEKIRSVVDRRGDSATVLSERGESVVANVRRTQVCWLDYQEYSGLYNTMWTIATTANQLFQYDIFEMPERIQLAMYSSHDKGFFELHMDTVPSDMTRKLSISVPLNDPSEYSGGGLEFHQGTSAIKVEQRPGVPIIFPSWLPHRITPVTSGKRYSLVQWVRGPNWR